MSAARKCRLPANVPGCPQMSQLPANVSAARKCDPPNFARKVVARKLVARKVVARKCRDAKFSGLSACQENNLDLPRLGIGHRLVATTSRGWGFGARLDLFFDEAKHFAAAARHYFPDRLKL
ncbi:unnamed protein product [Bursaphelenchus xylophilus]|uniref:(pine wood nematode) hypothetical protein n=1 Tax=Bursaphelenchus xylophilus TaxID=6326 RepID=A0A7I8XA94_BURXY|nr:unnamed protein product [Bursaphelenchus xylophilus]CAG9118665.1 unnamed protein product [Bursaphelenchus xylophilus]